MLPNAQVMYAQIGDEAIKSLLREQTEAWNRNDAKGWTKDFLEDANFINVRGDLVKGRAAIDTIGHPATNVAVVETSTELTNYRGLPPGLVETSPGVLRTRLKLILVNGDSGWKIFGAQNTAIVPQPMPVAQTAITRKPGESGRSTRSDLPN